MSRLGSSVSPNAIDGWPEVSVRRREAPVSGLDLRHAFVVPSGGPQSIPSSRQWNTRHCFRVGRWGCERAGTQFLSSMVVLTLGPRYRSL